ncbi:hypothetical protein [Arthrobacter sp. SX1312]
MAAAATILHLTPGSAKTRLHRARKRLRDQPPDPAPARPLTLSQEGQA